MLRRLLIILPSLLLLMLALLWIVSYFRYVDVSFGTAQRVVQLAVARGRVRLLHKAMPTPTVPPWRSKSGPPLEWVPGVSCVTESGAEEIEFVWYRPFLSVVGEWGWAPARAFPGGIEFQEGTVCEDGDSEDSYLYPFWFVEAPLAWPVVAAAFVTALALVTWWRGRGRIRPGLCTACGYDLRAHKPGEKCPECGTAIASAPCRRQRIRT